MTVNGSTKCTSYRWCWQPWRFPQDQISWIAGTIPSEPKFKHYSNLFPKFRSTQITSCYKLSCKFQSLFINLQPSWRRAMYMSKLSFINVNNTGPALEKQHQRKMINDIKSTNMIIVFCLTVFPRWNVLLMKEWLTNHRQGEMRVDEEKMGLHWWNGFPLRRYLTVPANYSNFDSNFF